ncbi:MAG: RNA polymerase sigma factor [Acidimicrobiales bacterium]
MLCVTSVGAMVRAAAGGDALAWGRLIDRFAGLIWAIARSHGLSVADADDVTQTTWLRLSEHLDKLRDPERVGAWLAVTARNESLRQVRRARRDVPFDPTVDVRRPVGGGEVDCGLLTEERDQALWRAFKSLPPNCRVLLLMLTSDPALSYEEVSASLEIPVGSIGPTRGRCLDRLRNDSQLQSCLQGDQVASLRRTAS